MTSRGRAALVLGVAVWVVAWVFGSPALVPVAAGLIAAVILAVAWVRLSLRSPALVRSWRERELLEGDEVAIELALEPGPGVALPTAAAEERIGRAGERHVELRRSQRRRYVGSYRLLDLPRGRHEFAPVRVVVADPWRLAETAVTVDGRQALAVYPRLVELEALFLDGGGDAGDGRRLMLQRTAGFELYGVRDHQQGESLRRVHWPSTARRRALMVKELEDSPRNEVAVLLDGDPAGAVGEPPDSSFDVAVRAAGSILRAQVRRGRRSVLVLNAHGRESQAVAAEADWHRALELLAAVEPDARTPVSTLLASGVGPAARALELVVVTSRPGPALVSRLLERALSRRHVALVHVEASSFAGRERPPEPGLLRLQAAGVPVAVVRRGDDLAAALGRPTAEQHAPRTVAGTVTELPRKAARA